MKILTPMNKIKEVLTEWFKPIVTIGIVILIIVNFTNFCERTKYSEGIVPASRVIRQTTETKTKTKIDTVTIVKQPIYNEIVKEKIVFRDTSTYRDVEKDTTYPVLNFKSKFEDTLISGNILSKVMLDGTLVHQDLEYTPKFPKYIMKTDSIFTTHTKYIKPEPKIKFLLGGEVSYNFDNKKLGISPEAGLIFKQGDQVTVRYDVLNNGLGIGYSRIFNYNK